MKQASRSRYTHESFCKKVEKINPSIKILGKFSTVHDKIKVLCTKHNLKYYVKGYSILVPRGCVKCKSEKAKLRKVSYEKSKKELLKLHENLFINKSSYTGKVNLCKIKCSIHKIEFTNSVSRCLNSKYPCPICLKESVVKRLSISKNKFKAIVKNKSNGNIKVTDFKTYQEKCKFTCKLCGHTWETKPINLNRNFEGVRKNIPCPNCHVQTNKKVSIKGKTFYLQGYEEIGIKWILNNTSIKVKDIEAHGQGKTPTIKFNKGKNWHIPDLYIKNINLLVEVKSTATMGLVKSRYGDNGKLFNKLVEKRKAAVKAGYRYKVIVFDGNQRYIKLPSKWYELSLPVLIKKLSEFQ
jgi:hypothetical protein